MTRILAFFVAFLLAGALYAQTPQVPAKSVPLAVTMVVPTQQAYVTQQVVTYPTYAAVVVAEPAFYKVKIRAKYKSRGSTRCCGY